jgi:hypothetical protein
MSITWSPLAGMNVVSVERREQALTVTVDSREPTFCPECGAQSKSRTAPTGERSGIYPLKERRSLFMPASGAGGVETSSVIGSSSPSACPVLRRRSPAGPPAWRESSGCLAIALADGPRSG